jgi:hypothetical protein
LDALRFAARLIIYIGDENAMRPEHSCTELDLIPLLDKVKLEELELFKEFRLVELQPKSRFNSFRSSLVLSISSAAFPTMT